MAFSYLLSAGPLGVPDGLSDGGRDRYDEIRNNFDGRSRLFG